MTTILTFTIPGRAWLTSNRHVAHRAQLSSIRALLHENARIRCRGVEPAATPCIAIWTIRYPKGVSAKADASNAQPTTKALLDAVVSAGVLPDDGSKHVTHEVFTRGPNHDIPPSGYGTRRQAVHVVALTLTNELHIDHEES